MWLVNNTSIIMQVNLNYNGYGGAVRPVINVYKSALEANNNE